MHIQFDGHRRFNGAQKLQEFVAAMPPMQLPMTSPVAISSAANKEVVPWRM